MLFGFNKTTVSHIHDFVAMSAEVSGSILKAAYSYTTGIFSGPEVLPEPITATIKQLPSPFEWINKSPVPSDISPIYCDLTFGNNVIWPAYISDTTIKMIGSYANPIIEVAVQGAEYIPFLLEAPRVYGLTKDVYHGRFNEGAIKALSMSGSGLISYAVSEYGIIALPVGVISKYGIEKAFEYYYPKPGANAQLNNSSPGSSNQDEDQELLDNNLKSNSKVMIFSKPTDSKTNPTVKKEREEEKEEEIVKPNRLT